MATGLKDQQDQKSTTDPSERFDDDALNPGQQVYQDQFERGMEDVSSPADMLSGAEKKAAEESRAGSEHTSSLQDSEESAGFTTDVSPRASSSAKGGRNKAFPIIAIFTVLLSVFSLGTISLNSLPIAIMKGTFDNFDSVGSVASARSPKVLNFLFGESDVNTAGVCTSVKIKCSKAGRISYKAMSKMANKNIVGVFEDGTKYSVEQHGKKGYPEKNAVKWEVTDDSGKVTTFDADKFNEFYTDPANSKAGRKFFGTRGFVNMSIHARAGKHITGKVYNILNLGRKGGIVENLTKKIDPKGALSALKAKMPVALSIEAHMAKLNARFGAKIGAVQKGQTAYTVSAMSCMALMLPDVILGRSTAEDMQSGTKVAQDIVYSPASMAQSNVIHETYTADYHDTVGSILTEKVPDEDGVERAAVDSPVLLNSMGVDKSKGVVSKYAPGYGAMKDPTLSAGRLLQDGSRVACGFILSAPVIATAIASDIAVKVIASTTLVGLFAVFAIDILVDQATSVALAEGSKAIMEYAINSLSSRQDIVDAATGGGKPLGDVVGVYGAALIQLENSATIGNTGTVSQLPKAVAMQQRYEEQVRQDDIASLSPFDTSSKYTFFGSLLHQAQNASLLSGFYSNRNLASLLSTFINIASVSLTSKATASALDVNSEMEKCQFANDWNYPKTESGEEYAVASTGIPCSFGVSAHETMGTDEAFDELVNSGYFNEEAEINDSDSLEDLMSTVDQNGAITQEKYIKADTPLWFKMRDCSNFAEGEYFANIASCVVQGSSALSLKTAEAISVFMFDFLMIQVINGENDDDNAANAGSSSPNSPPSLVSPSEWSVASDHDGYLDKTSSEWFRWVEALGGNGSSSTGVLQAISGTPYDGSICPQSNGLNQNGGGNLFNPNAAASFSALILAFNAANPGKYLTGGACFRSLEGQNKAYDQYGSPRAATPGTSNHGWGLAIDLRISTSPGQAGTSPQSISPEYDWLLANSPAYGWVNPANMRPGGSGPLEPWHFQYVGPLFGSGGASSS